MLDALAASHPDNPAVLLAAADAQMAYATGFVDKEHKERAKAMYLKAKTYGLRALARNKRFARALDQCRADRAMPAGNGQLVVQHCARRAFAAVAS